MHADVFRSVTMFTMVHTPHTQPHIHIIIQISKNSKMLTTVDSRWLHRCSISTFSAEK